MSNVADHDADEQAEAALAASSGAPDDAQPGAAGFEVGARVSVLRGRRRVVFATVIDPDATIGAHGERATAVLVQMDHDGEYKLYPPDRLLPAPR